MNFMSDLISLLMVGCHPESPIPIPKPTPMHTYKATLIKVVDGDTVDLMVDLGFRQFMRDRFRLFGIAAWEPRGEEKEKGLKAKEALIRLIEGNELIVYTHKNDKRGKYGRWLTVIWIKDINVNEWLVREGHAISKSY